MASNREEQPFNRSEREWIYRASGYAHPGQYTPHDVEISAGPGIFMSLFEIYGYEKAQLASNAAPKHKEPDAELTKKMVQRLSIVS